MSAELLRRAAALMRERAEAASGKWHPSEHWYAQHEIRAALRTAETSTDAAAGAEHIASWHPAVALAVADWLDAEVVAVTCGPGGYDPDLMMPQALAVARAYLGESA